MLSSNHGLQNDNIAVDKKFSFNQPKTGYLIKVGKKITSSLNFRQTLVNTAEVLVPDMADWVAIDVLKKGKLTLLYIKHRDPKKTKIAKLLTNKFPARIRGQTAIGNVVGNRKAEFYPHITAGMFGSETDDDQKVAYQKLGISSVMIVPLKVRDRTFGSLTFCKGQSGRRYSRQDLKLAVEIGDLVGPAIQNALAFQKARFDIARQQKISEKLAQLGAIVESSKDAILSKDLDGLVTSWNLGAERMYGYSASEIIGKSVSLLFPLDKKAEFESIMSRIKLGQYINQFETVRIRSDGKKINVSISASPIWGQGNKIIGACVIARDITAQIELEQRKDDFIYIASHEFKTPLTTLKGFSQIMLQKPDNLESSRLSYLKKMDHQINKLNQLIDDLLDVAEIQSERVDLKKEKFWMNELITGIVTELQKTTQHKIIIKSNPKLFITGDKKKISKVLTNLLANAIKYSPQADKIIIASQQIKNEIIVSVQDFGIGIFSKDRLKIFDRFYQAKNKIRESFAGLGLGLFITKKIIQLHNGKIWVKSNKGEGSTFCISLPIN